MGHRPLDGEELVTFLQETSFDTQRKSNSLKTLRLVADMVYYGLWQAPYYQGNHLDYSSYSVSCFC